MASAKETESAAKIARSRVAAIGKALTAAQSTNTAAIGDSPAIRRATAEVADVRVGLLTDLVTSLYKIAMEDKPSNSAASTNLRANKTDVFAMKSADPFAVKDLLERNLDKLTRYPERFEPGYMKSVGTGGLSFALRDYANNS